MKLIFVKKKIFMVKMNKLGIGLVVGVVISSGAY